MLGLSSHVSLRFSELEEFDLFTISQVSSSMYGYTIYVFYSRMI